MFVEGNRILPAPLQHVIELQAVVQLFVSSGIGFVDFDGEGGYPLSLWIVACNHAVKCDGLLLQTGLFVHALLKFHRQFVCLRLAIIVLPGTKLHPVVKSANLRGSVDIVGRRGGGDRGFSGLGLIITSVIGDAAPSGRNDSPRRRRRRWIATRTCYTYTYLYFLSNNPSPPRSQLKISTCKGTRMVGRRCIVKQQRPGWVSGLGCGCLEPKLLYGSRRGIIMLRLSYHFNAFIMSQCGKSCLLAIAMYVRMYEPPSR